MPGPRNDSPPKKASSKTKSSKAKKAAAADKPTKSYSEQRTTAKANAKKHAKSQNTTISYEGQVGRGQLYLKQFVREEGEAEKEWQARNPDQRLSGVDEDEMDEGEQSLDPQFHSAFDGPPVECTPLAISMFMHFKCFEEGNKSSTAVSIHAAFKRHYKMM